jgi:hypothetical protein
MGRVRFAGHPELRVMASLVFTLTTSGRSARPGGAAPE